MSRIPEPHLTAWRGLLNAHSAVVERVEQALREAGLPPLSWYDLLWALRRAPGRRLRMSELADSLTISRGGLTKLADRLEEASLIGREPSPGDRRGSVAVLRPEGERMLRRMWPVYAGELDRHVASLLSAREAETLARLLERVHASASAGAAAAAA